MLPYKLPEHEAFHPTSFGTSEWWQSSSWSRNSPSPLPPVTLQDHHHNFHHSHISHRSFFCKEDSQQTHLPADSDSLQLEGINYLSNSGEGNAESGVPKWDSDEACHSGPTPASAPVLTSSSAPTSGRSGSGSGDAFWSSTLSRVAAVAAAAMACAAVPQKNPRDGCSEFEDASLGVEESEKVDVKEPWCRNQRKSHSRR